MIPYGKQDISEEDIAAVVEVLRSDFLTQGPKVPEFEQAVANYCGAKHAIATNSATSALHIACLALNVGKGDIVWTSPISFVASANCALYCNADIDFVDIDINSGNISLDSLKAKLIKAQLIHLLPKVLIVVHLAGQSALMSEIKQLAKQYNFALIEDASHATGGKYQGNTIGCGKFSDITIFSFHPVKIITSAEGGMALTNNTEIAHKIRLLRSHGIVSDQNLMNEESHGPWYYQQLELGFNYRMTDLQAALGLSQLKRLDEFIDKRNILAQVYNQAFSDTAITPLLPHNDTLSAYHLYVILLPEKNAIKHKNTVLALREAGICAHVHYIPIHLQPYYANLGFNKGDFPIAEQYYQRAITLPLFPLLTSSEQQYIIDTLIKLVE
jgi:UDP-4-amino-4,6-dideoxy-N-acetyl-beta-L-altrosamine transaminase